MEEITYLVMLSVGGLMLFASLLISVFLQVVAKKDYLNYIVINLLGIVVALWLMWVLLQ